MPGRDVYYERGVCVCLLLVRAKAKSEGEAMNARYERNRHNFVGVDMKWEEGHEIAAVSKQGLHKRA